MEEDLVSVIIPTYNRVDYVQIAIDSVLTQTYSPIEIFVVDDGSSDNTGKILDKRYGKRINYIWQENQGESFARNKGLSHAKGEYIAFLDSDDYWEPHKIESQVGKLKKEVSKKVVGVFSTVWVVDGQGNKTKNKPIGFIKSPFDLSFESFLSKVPIFCAPSNLLLKATAIKAIGGFDTSIQYGEDQDFLLRLRRHFDFTFIDEPLVFYRIHDSNQSKIVSKKALHKIFSDRLNIVKKNTAQNKCVDSRVVEEVTNRILTSAASWHFYYGQWGEGIDCLMKIDKQKDHAFEKVLPAKIANIASIKYKNQGLSLEEADEFIDNFLESIDINWNKMAMKFYPNKIKGLFFYEVICDTNNVKRFSMRHLMSLFVRHFPDLIKYFPIKSLIKASG